MPGVDEQRRNRESLSHIAIKLMMRPGTGKQMTNFFTRIDICRQVISDGKVDKQNLKTPCEVIRAKKGFVALMVGVICRVRRYRPQKMTLLGELFLVEQCSSQDEAELK